MKNRIFTLLWCLVAFVGAAMADEVIIDHNAGTLSGDKHTWTGKEDTPTAGYTLHCGSNSTKTIDAGVAVGDYKAIKFSAGERYILDLPESVSVTAVTFVGYSNDASSDTYLSELNNTTYGANDYPFPAGKGKTETVSHTIKFDTPVTGSISFIVGGKQSGLYLVLTTASEPEGPSSDASIAKVELGGNEVYYNEGSYYATIPATYTKEKITLKVTPTDAKAVVTVDLDDTPNTKPGEYATDLLVEDLGDYGAKITVTAEDGTTTYSVNLVANKATEADTDNSLAKVTVDGEELTADDSGTNYPYTIPFDYSGELTVAAEATSQYATVLILDTDNNPTVAGGQSAVVPVKVKAESGDIATYTVTITREAASTACDLTAFSINGFKGVIDGTNVTVKTVEGYDFSHTPVMSISEKAVAAWDAAAKTVVVTAQDGTTAQTYTVAAAAEYVQPYTVTETAHISLAAADAPEGYEWIYGPNYNPTMADFESVAVGGYDLAKASDAANVAAGKNILKVYVANCATLTFNLGATGTRKVNVSKGETALVTGFAIDSDSKNKMVAVPCEVNSREAVVLEVEAFTKDGLATNGGTRIFSIDVTPMAEDPTSIQGPTAEGMAIYTMDGQVMVSTAEAAIVNVYAIDGRLVRRVELTEGTNVVSGLARGMYLINNQKVIVK